MSFVPLRYFFLLTVLLSCSPGATREIEPFYAEVEQAFVQVRTGQTDMEETSKRLLDKAEKLFGKDSGPVAGLRHDLGWLHREFGNHAAAEEHFKQAIELQDRAAEDDDTIGAAFRFSLAELYRDAGRYDVSETFYKKSLDVLDKRPRESVDLETVHVLNGLGLLYKELGRLPEAESYFLRAMEKIESVRESCRPEYASLVNNLALVYLDQGRYGEAETLYKQLISDGESEDFAGPEDTIHLLNNLALLYCNQGRYDDAEPLYRKSLEIIARHSKADRRRETVVLVNLSLLHANRKRFDESETAANDALHSITEEPPENSPLYPSVMHAFSTCYFRQGRKEEAEEYARKALDFFRKRAQHDQGAAHHGATATAMNNLAKILFDLRRYPEAEPLFDQAIVLLENRVSRPDSVALVYNNRARLFKALGRRDEAVRDLKKSLELSSEARKKVSGTDEQRAETFSRQYFLFARMVDWQYEFGNMEEAYEAMERSRAQGLQDLIQSHGIDLLQGVSPDLAERLRLETTIAQGAVKSLERQLEHLERKGETDQPEKTSEIRESKRLLKDAQKRLVEAWAAIKDASPAYRMMMGSDRKPVPLAAIREELEMEKGIALEYQIGREKSYVLVYGVGFPAKLFPLRLDKEQAAIFNVPEGF